MQVQRHWSSSELGLFGEHPGGPGGKNRVSRGGKNEEGQQVLRSWGCQIMQGFVGPLKEVWLSL